LALTKPFLGRFYLPLLVVIAVWRPSELSPAVPSPMVLRRLNVGTGASARVDQSITWNSERAEGVSGCRRNGAARSEVSTPFLQLLRSLYLYRLADGLPLPHKYRFTLFKSRSLLNHGWGSLLRAMRTPRRQPSELVGPLERRCGAHLHLESTSHSHLPQFECFRERFSSVRKLRRHGTLISPTPTKADLCLFSLFVSSHPQPHTPPPHSSHTPSTTVSHHGPLRFLRSRRLRIRRFGFGSRRCWLCRLPGRPP
jgi:hypothetical protein